jgi:hypothetical protein
MSVPSGHTEGKAPAVCANCNSYLSFLKPEFVGRLVVNMNAAFVFGFSGTAVAMHAH